MIWVKFLKERKRDKLLKRRSRGQILKKQVTQSNKQIYEKVGQGVKLEKIEKIGNNNFFKEKM